MDDTGGPRGEDLAETTQRQNSNLQRLIDAVGTLLTGSREVLKRLQFLSEGRSTEPSDSGPETDGRQRDAPPDTLPPDNSSKN